MYHPPFASSHWSRYERILIGVSGLFMRGRASDPAPRRDKLAKLRRQSLYHKRCMKAAVYTRTKSGKALEIVDIQRSASKDNEVLVRSRAASVNPLHWRMKSRRPGMDVAGEVITVGNRVAQFKPGDAIFGACKGAFAEYVCAAGRYLEESDLERGSKTKTAIALCRAAGASRPSRFQALFRRSLWSRFRETNLR